MRVGVSGIGAALAIGGCVGLSAVVMIGGSGRAQPAYATPVGLYQKVEQAQAPPTRALFIGDDYAAGTEGLLTTDTFAGLACARMGWVCNVDAESGTGYVNNGHDVKVTHAPYLDRLAHTSKTFAADVVIVSGGRNDGASPKSSTAIGAYFRAVHRAYPEANVVALSPFWEGAKEPAWLQRQRRRVEVVAAAGGACYVDTTGWLKPDLITEGTPQPTAVGQSEIADRLVAELKNRAGCQF